jgi:protein phosphatase PTC7
LIDYPRDADLINALQLEDGDVVMLATDGFGDNVFEEGEANVLVTAVRQKLEAAHNLPDAFPLTRPEKDAEFASAVASTAVSFARMISVREDKVTPFEVESKKWLGAKRAFKGGKVDDVTVVVAVVRKE